MNITEFAVKNQVVTWLTVFLLCVGGIVSYFNLGKLEDPEFTVKTAVVATRYLGAGPEQVEKEVTEKIELAIQEIPEVDFVESMSRQGLSIVRVTIKSQYWSDKLPQIWNTLRHKISNIEGSLPQGASKPQVADDFGDVYGFVIAVTGDGFSYNELEEYVKNIKRKLSLVENVSRVEFWGKQNRAVYIKVSESSLAKIGISANDLSSAITQQNRLSASGNIYYDQQFARIEVTGEFQNLQDIGELVIGGRDGKLTKLRDFAKIEEGVMEPAIQTMRYNSQPALALSISNVAGSNIIELGGQLEQRLNSLQAELPVGIEVNKVAWQATEVDQAINSFLVNLLEAVLIVLVVLAISMGWRMGVIIGTALLLTILGTLIFMDLLNINLQRMSLGALVIALGMMVDNSIVVGDGIVSRMRQGQDKLQAALEAAQKPSMPLLGATTIAVLAFYPIGGSSESVGEYCLSLFQVVGIALLFSWVISVTVTPAQCYLMLKASAGAEAKDAYQSPLYKGYRSLLSGAIRGRWITLVLMLGLLVASVYSFRFVSQMFFPDSSRPQFMVDMYAPNGTRIAHTSELLKKAEDKILTLEGVESVSSFIGSGPPRFYLPVEPEMFFSSYGQLIVNVENYQDIDAYIAELKPWLQETFPDVPTFRARKYGVGPSNTWKFELRLLAPPDASPNDIRQLGEQGLKLIQDHPWVEASQLDWRERTPKAEVQYDPHRGELANVNRNTLSGATLRAFDGRAVGQYRYGDETLPILLRNEGSERNNPSSLYTVQIPQLTSPQTVPLTQVVESVNLVWEDPYIWRRDRLRMIRIQAAPKKGVTLPSLQADVQEKVAEFERNLPIGYSLEWGAEAESSADSQASLVPGLIPAFTLMFFIVVLLFNALKPAFIIFLTIPLALIGIVAGLLGANVPFGFMALLGALSLIGMMIKNAIVLIDEIRMNIEEKHMDSYDAVINAGLSRLNPVLLAAVTTVLGVIPLIQDVFWVSMAMTIMSGLTFGTILTMVVVPVLYCIFYRIERKTSSV